jgi:hypothetical protein
MLLSPVIGWLKDEGQHGQKPKKFCDMFSKISIVNIFTSKPNIEKNIKMVLRDGLCYNFKTNRLFLGAANF